MHSSRLEAHHPEAAVPGASVHRAHRHVMFLITTRCASSWCPFSCKSNAHSTVGTVLNNKTQARENCVAV